MKMNRNTEYRMSNCSAASAAGTCFAASFSRLLMDTVLSVSIILLIGLLPLVISS
ncbi:MAG: hypothetical protein ACI4V3_03325 [Faecousia sp.]